MGPKVLHRHRVGSQVFRRVSELVFVDGKPRAILGWINLAGIRTPLYICELDPSRLRRSSHSATTYYYDETTVDPRFVETDDESFRPPPPPG